MFLVRLQTVHDGRRAIVTSRYVASYVLHSPLFLTALLVSVPKFRLVRSAGSDFRLSGIPRLLAGRPSGALCPSAAGSRHPPFFSRRHDWGNWENSAGKEGTDKGYKSASGQCDGDTHLDIWL